MEEIVMEGLEFITMATVQGVFIVTGVMVNVLSWVSLRTITDASPIFKQTLLVLVCVQLVNLCFSQTFILIVLVLRQWHLGDHVCTFHSYVSMWSAILSSWLLLVLVVDRFIQDRFVSCVYHYTRHYKITSCVMWLALLSLSSSVCYHLVIDVENSNSGRNEKLCHAPFSKTQTLTNSAVTFIVPMTIRMTLLIYLTCYRRKNQIEQEIMKADTTGCHGDDLNDLSDLKVDRPKTPWGEAWWSEINHKIKSGPNTTLPPLSLHLPPNTSRLLLATRNRSINEDSFPHREMKLKAERHLGGSMPDLAGSDMTSVPGNEVTPGSEVTFRIAWLQSEERRNSLDGRTSPFIDRVSPFIDDKIRGETFQISPFIDRVSPFIDDKGDGSTLNPNQREHRDKFIPSESDNPLRNREYPNKENNDIEMCTTEGEGRFDIKMEANTASVDLINNYDHESRGKSSDDRRKSYLLENRVRHTEKERDRWTENSPSDKKRWSTRKLKKGKKGKMDDKDLVEADSDRSSSEKHDRVTSCHSSNLKKQLSQKQGKKKSINGRKSSSDEKSGASLPQQGRQSLITSQQTKGDNHLRHSDTKSRTTTLQTHIDAQEYQLRSQHKNLLDKTYYQPVEKMKPSELENSQDNLENKTSQESNNSVDNCSDEVIEIEGHCTANKIGGIQEQEYLFTENCTAEERKVKLHEYTRTLLKVSVINLLLTLPRVAYGLCQTEREGGTSRYWTIWMVDWVDSVSNVFTPLLIISLHKSFRIITLYFLQQLTCKS